MTVLLPSRLSRVSQFRAQLNGPFELESSVSSTGVGGSIPKAHKFQLRKSFPPPYRLGFGQFTYPVNSSCQLSDIDLYDKRIYFLSCLKVYWLHS